LAFLAKILANSARNKIKITQRKEEEQWAKKGWFNNSSWRS
jgi:hypothetical protein